jgi:hypothetical protein
VCGIGNIMESECKHDYKILDIKYTKTEVGYRTYTFRRITSYFCSKCLKEETRIKEEHSQELPDWWNNN